MIMPYTITGFGSIGTDPSKKFIASMFYNYEYRGNNSAVINQLEPGITYRPINNLKIGVTANYISNRDNLQYISTNYSFPVTGIYWGQLTRRPWD